MTEILPQLWCEGMVFGKLFTLGCEVDNQVATTPIMSKIEAVQRMFRFFGCIVVFFCVFFGRGTTFNGFVEVEGHQMTQNGCFRRVIHISNWVG